MVDVGQQAPDFTLVNQHGEQVTLSSYRGDKNVVLVFYPFAFSGICTGELCEIRDRLESFDNDSTVTLAVSCDSKFVQRVFADREGYTFSMLTDYWPHGAVARDYGIFVEEAGAAKRGDLRHRQGGRGALDRHPRHRRARDAASYEEALAAL